MSFLEISLPSPSGSSVSIPMTSPISPSTHTHAHDSDSDREHADIPVHVPPPVAVSVSPARPARLPPPALNLDDHFLTPLHTAFIPRSERMYSPSTDALLDLLSLEAESAPSPWMLHWKEWGSAEHTIYDLDHDHPLRLTAVDTVESVVKDRDMAESIVTYGLEVVCSLIERPEIADERISALDQFTLQHLCTFSVDLLTAVISNRPLAKQMHDYFVERVWWRRHSAAVSPSHKISSFVYANFFDTYS